MKIRIITAVILIAAVVAWLYLADYAIFTLGALAIYAVAAKEMGQLLGFARPYPFLLCAAVAASVMFYFAPPGLYAEGYIPSFIKYFVALSLPLWIVLFFAVQAYPQGTGWHKNKILGVVLGLMLLLPFLQGLLILRAESFNDNYYTGANLVLAVMALVWCADSGAYFTGRAVGKNKLIEAVSPNKTREGLYGGIALALLGLLIFDALGCYASFGVDRLALMISGFGAILFSVLGDLVESMLKRMVKIKDSGTIFPGHGGMLDRIDAQLAAIPLFITLNYLVRGDLLP